VNTPDTGLPTTLTRRLQSAKSPLQALNVLRLGYAEHDARVAEIIRKFHIQLACHAGCDLCCVFRVSAKAHEILLMAETIRAEWPATAQAELRSRLGESARIARGMTRAEHEATNLPCALLVDRQCPAYSVRPLACRRHHAQDLEGCRFLRDHPESAQHPGARCAELRYATDTLESAMAGVFAECDYDVEDYELNMALHEALTAGEALGRWGDRRPAFEKATQKEA